MGSNDDTGEPNIIDSDTGDTEETGDPDTGEINLPPSAPEVAIEPEEPTEDDDLICAITKQSVDPEGETVTYHYEWDVDGQNPEIDSDTVPASETWVDHVWTCTAWADDGKHTSDTDSATVTIQQACYDFGVGEDNGSEGDAVGLGEMKDKDDPVTLEGLLDGHEDQDWYMFIGRDTISASRVAPGLELGGGTVPVRACLFASCLNGLGKTEVECPDEAESQTSPSGLPGCCSYADFEMDLNCKSTTDDEAAMYLLVYTDMEDVCEPYQVTYWY